MITMITSEILIISIEHGILINLPSGWLKS